MPSSRAASRAHVSAGPSSGWAPAAVSSGLASTGHFSGRTTRSAPAAAAARVSRSAASRLRSRSAVELSCTAAALTAIAPLSPGLTRQSIPLRRGYRGPMRTSPWVPGAARPARPGRPATVPLPPARMPLVRGGRPLKRWRWVGAFSADTMLCAARAFIGGVPVTWWAIWDGERLHERTQRRPGAVRMEPGARAGVAARPQLRGGRGRRGRLAPRRAVHLDAQAGRHADARLGARPAVRGLRLHRRHRRLPRAPHRLALVGRGRDRRVRRARAWNLVDGVHDGPEHSERTVWLDGTPHHVEPSAFAGDLSAVGDLRCEAVAVRARRERRSSSPPTTSSRSGASRARCRTQGRFARAGV